MRSVRSCAVVVLLLAFPAFLAAQPLPGTKLLEGKDDFARVMVDGIDRYLDRATQEAVRQRPTFWKSDFSSGAAYAKSVEPLRQELARILGVVDRRVPVRDLEHVGTTSRPALLAETQQYRVYAVRWPVLPGIDGEGLLLEPTGKVVAQVVALPDADQEPEDLVGFTKTAQPAAQFARRLAENGCRVVVPALIDRKDTWSGSPRLGRFTNQTHREFVYRMAYEMGRHVIGYEIQRALAVVDWFTREKDHAPVGIFGYGEGGLLALYAGALDTRIRAVGVSGHFGPRENLQDEPIYRNVWGLLRKFGDAEVLRLIVPRAAVIEQAALKVAPPPGIGKGRAGAAPGQVRIPTPAAAFAEFQRTAEALPSLKDFPRGALVWKPPAKDEAGGSPGRDDTLRTFLKELGDGFRKSEEKAPVLADHPPAAARRKRLFDQLVEHTQDMQPASAARREEFVWSKLDTTDLPKFRTSQEPLRDYFWKNIIGKLPPGNVPMNPRTRLVYDTPKWKGYEVVLDLYDGVICHGYLLVPKDIKPGEKRPVVVCQHGLEGRPTDVVNPEKKTPYYNSFGAALADKGFIVFAPQNPYIFRNDFRQVARKANALEQSLYAFIVRQHERILQFLSGLDFVDPGRIAYYGLSYGGKVAMRIPALLLQYCLSICSGDFNEWIWKNINLDWRGSYMFTGEYEMVEFDLGNTFNYAEMAALIAPRPFMVERGHGDGVGLDEYVAFEYAKVRRLYARLGIPDRTAIEFFSGGHEIHLQGTLAFLRKHLNWPER